MLFSRIHCSVALILLAILSSNATGQVLVGDAFTTPYAASGWVDAFPARGSNWRLGIGTTSLVDANNAAPGTGTNTGTYDPNVLINNNFLAPASYELSAMMRSNDDDLMGLVFNYQDPDNYFRLGLRQQPASGNAGGTEGLSIQKVVNGVLTQIIPVTAVAGPAAITQAQIDNRTPFEAKVVVNGSNYEVFFDGVSKAVGTDADLAAGRKIGFQAWAQSQDTTGSLAWGAEVESVTVKQGVTTLFNHTFELRNTPWRTMVMKNTAGTGGGVGVPVGDRALLGNFGQAITSPWIVQESNGNLSASGVANVDFVGPAIAIDTPGANALTNYQMRVRLGASDNDGYGLVVRVQDDDNFYRINFHNENSAIGTTRPPRGMSVQKVRNGVWSQLYADDQFNIPFLPPVTAGATRPGDAGFQPFDVLVSAVGSDLKIQVRDAGGVVYDYPLITDSTDPILAGSVGLTTWGNEDTFYLNYGGVSGPLLSTLNALSSIAATVDRGTGKITLTNNGVAPINIEGISISSIAGSLNSVAWKPVATFYDEAPGDGTVDPDDPWTITSTLPTLLSESEQSVGGNGGMLSAGQSVDLGNAWIKSIYEGVSIEVQLAGGGTAVTGTTFSGGPTGLPYVRADLNTDGMLTVADWTLFHPNLLADLSSMTLSQKSLAGDLDLDGDNDVLDFYLFKSDFDLANGSGAFAEMLGSVPEPGSVVLLISAIAGCFAFWRRRPSACLTATLATAIVMGTHTSASAAVADLTMYTVEPYPQANTFGVPTWDLTTFANGAVVKSGTLGQSPDASVFYSPDSALNKRYIGLMRPGTDDDVLGFVLGFEPGDAQIQTAPGTADYLLIDWKGATQSFNFSDQGAINFHHDKTPTGSMPVGLAISRVTGSPTADEMWQHANLVGNDTGGVVQLARGATLGSAAYNRAGGTHLFDITYTSTNVTVKIDGVEQLNVNGSFPDGRFGLYQGFQGTEGDEPAFGNIEVVPATGFTGLSAEIDRSNGNIKLKNTGSVAVDFDYYQLSSPAGSLNEAGWVGIKQQNFFPGAPWEEAGGSSDSALAEAYFQAASSLAGGGMIDLGAAYDHNQNAQDVTLVFRLSGGAIATVLPTYIGAGPGDHNGDGKVNAADYVLWRKNPGAFPPNAYDLWRANFGNPPGSGSSLDGGSVPEPATLALVICASLMLVARREIRN